MQRYSLECVVHDGSRVVGQQTEVTAKTGVRCQDNAQRLTVVRVSGPEDLEPEIGALC